MKIVVMHGYYGCETGCCGHFVEIDGEELGGSFDFDHPNGQDYLEFAKEFVEIACGKQHVKDLDWKNCFIVDD